MESLLFFLGTLVIVLAVASTTALGLLLHHRREMERHRIREQEVQGMFLLSDKALDKGMLPPGLRAPRDY